MIQRVSQIEELHILYAKISSFSQTNKKMKKNND